MNLTMKMTTMRFVLSGMSNQFGGHNTNFPTSSYLIPTNLELRGTVLVRREGRCVVEMISELLALFLPEGYAVA
jgi:hypothetical protein